MARIFVSIAGAFLSGMLLYFGQAHLWAMLFAPVCFAIMSIIVDKNARGIMFLSVIIFTLSYLFIQTVFLWDTDGKNGLEVLYCVFPFLIYFLPQAGLLLTRKYKVPLFLTGWLLSELIFIHIQLGCSIYRLGNIWANYPPLIQWYEYTGIYGGSLWTALLGYGLYYAIASSSLKFISFALFIPLIWSAGLLLVQKSVIPERTVQVAILSLNKEYKACDIDSTIYANRFHPADFIVLPEAIVSYDARTYRYSSFMTSIKRNLTDTLSHTSAILGLWLKDCHKKFYNVVLDYSRQGEQMRSKELRMPFAEYLPYANFLGQFEFFQNLIRYPISVQGNDTRVFWKNGVEYSPLICYEAICLDFLCDISRDGAQFFTVSASNSSLNSMHIERTGNNILKASAIATRRSIVRSVDNGLPCFITPTGAVTQLQPNSTAYVIQSVALERTGTFYMKHHRRITTGYLLSLAIIYLFFFIASIRDKLIKSNKRHLYI
jgi:apolipoprotein N-acyltransferase